MDRIQSIELHVGNFSHEVGANALGRVYHKIAHKVGDTYKYEKYSLNGPETAVVVAGVVVAVYYGGPVVGSASVALASALATGGIPLPT